MLVPCEEPKTYVDALAETVERLERGLWELACEGRHDAIAATLDPDFMGPHPTGLTWTRADALAAMPGLVIDVYALSAIRVIPVDVTSALMTYRLTLVGARDGQSLHQRFWCASLWSRRRGRWLNLYYQETAAEL
jgi:hypothetical protein